MAIPIPSRDLLELYASGWFPMAVGGELRLFSPDPRAVIPLDGFRIPHGSRRPVRDSRWSLRTDTDFAAVLDGCANRRETWIDGRIRASYLALHEAGHAHSVETWFDGALAGGLYGVRLGAAFFGESMFSAIPGASKAALAHLVRLLRAGGFRLLDIQWLTPHLAGFGGIEIPRAEYLRRLDAATARKARWPAPGR